MNAISPFFLLNLLLDLWDVTKSGFHLRHTALTVKIEAPPTFLPTFCLQGTANQRKAGLDCLPETTCLRPELTGCFKANVCKLKSFNKSEV